LSVVLTRPSQHPPDSQSGVFHSIFKGNYETDGKFLRRTGSTQQERALKWTRVDDTREGSAKYGASEVAGLIGQVATSTFIGTGG
jgi:hypothetical protein